MPRLEKFTPILRVKDLPAALGFYTRVLVSKESFKFKFSENDRTHYAGVSRDGQSLHLSTFEENGQANTQVFVTVDDVVRHSEFAKAGLNCLAPEDMVWGQREMIFEISMAMLLRFAMPLG